MHCAARKAKGAMPKSVSSDMREIIESLHEKTEAACLASRAGNLGPWHAGSHDHFAAKASPNSQPVQPTEEWLTLCLEKTVRTVFFWGLYRLSSRQLEKPAKRNLQKSSCRLFFCFLGGLIWCNCWQSFMKINLQIEFMRYSRENGASRIIQGIFTVEES